MSETPEGLSRAISLYGENRYEEAIEAYREVLEADPRCTDALHGLAMSYFQMQRFDEAIEAAKKIVAVAPDDAFAHTSLSMFYQRKGMIAEAEREAAEARVVGWRKELGGAAAAPEGTEVGPTPSGS